MRVNVDNAGYWALGRPLLHSRFTVGGQISLRTFINFNAERGSHTALDRLFTITRFTVRQRFVRLRNVRKMRI